MGRNKRESKGKSINPSYFIFCEGESEESYVQYLRNKYRLPVEIVSKVTKGNIDSKLIKKHISSRPQHEKDIIFLMYDIDVTGFIDKLNEIKKHVKSELLVSNPCFELWYYLHFNNQTAEISTDRCIKKLENICPDYKKGTISVKLKEKLETKQIEASQKAQNLSLYNNPSSSVYNLIKMLEKLR